MPTSRSKETYPWLHPTHTRFRDYLGGSSTTFDIVPTPTHSFFLDFLSSRLVSFRFVLSPLLSSPLLSSPLLLSLLISSHPQSISSPVSALSESPTDPMSRLEFILDYLDAEDPDGQKMILRTANGLAMLESKLQPWKRGEEESVAGNVSALERGLDMLASDLSRCLSLLKVRDSASEPLDPRWSECAALSRDDREELDALTDSVRLPRVLALLCSPSHCSCEKRRRRTRSLRGKSSSCRLR
eukprot:768744-Hanusia_phi.AAC.10